jgi:hypothetical protein
MSPHQVLAVSVRLFAIWLFLYATSNMTGSYVEAHRYSAPDSLVPLILGFCVIVFICAFLWFFPLFVARRILHSSTTNDVSPAAVDSWFSVGCSLIGVWVLATAIPALVKYGLVNYLGRKFWPDTFVANPEWPLLVAVSVFQLAVGIWLFIGGKGLKKVFDWARHA